MLKIVAIYGSPRRKGNTATLLDQAVAGAEGQGAQVEKVVLRDIKLSPCLEIYGCKKDGRCLIKDDFPPLGDRLLAADAIMIASPIFFYAVSAHTKIMMDRCQSLWVKKHWIENKPFGQKKFPKNGLFISVGATRGKTLFDGAIKSVRYFLEVLDVGLWKSLTFRGLDASGAVNEHPEYLQEAFEAGAELARLAKKPGDAG
jgi:multimeric flavodoxin WrbA